MQSTGGGGGTLAITIVEAKLSRDTEAFGYKNLNLLTYSKMDPFCVLEYNGNKYKTRTHQGGGKLPVWNHVRILKSLLLLMITCYIGIQYSCSLFE